MNKSMTAVSLMPILLITLAACDQGPAKEPTVEGRWYTQSQVDLGQGVFAKYCASCHGERAAGTGDWRVPLADGSYPPPPLNGTAHAWHHPMSVLESLIKEGGIPLGGKMPPFEGTLSDEQARAAIAYFQSFWSDEIYAKWNRMNE